MESTKLLNKLGTRIEVSKIFSPLTRDEERKWARIFKNGFDSISDELGFRCAELSLLQEIIGSNCLLWKDIISDTNECLISFIDDATSFDAIRKMYDLAEDLRPTFGYMIIHQAKDGEGTYDIFRMSKVSFLEHCNRVRVPKTQDLIIMGSQRYHYL